MSPRTQIWSRLAWAAAQSSMELPNGVRKQRPIIRVPRRPSRAGASSPVGARGSGSRFWRALYRVSTLRLCVHKEPARDGDATRHSDGISAACEHTPGDGRMQMWGVSVLRISRRLRMLKPQRGSASLCSLGNSTQSPKGAL